MDVIDELFPYRRDPGYDEWTCLFLRLPFLTTDVETAHNLAVWCRAKLGMGAPGTTTPPLVKFDALGGSGAPHESGEWIAADKPRAAVEVTTPDVSLTGRTEEELAQLLVDTQAAIAAVRAGTAVTTPVEGVHDGG